jgi:hypothetical protein
MDESERDDGWFTAVLDRIEADEDDLAVLVLERGGVAVDELVISLDVLPSAARVPDSVLCVRIEAGELAEATLDMQGTAMRQERAQNRFERLSRRLPRGGDGAKRRQLSLWREVS